MPHGDPGFCAVRAAAGRDGHLGGGWTVPRGPSLSGAQGAMAFASLLLISPKELVSLALLGSGAWRRDPRQLLSGEVAEGWDSPCPQGPGHSGSIPSSACSSCVTPVHSPCLGSLARERHLAAGESRRRQGS